MSLSLVRRGDKADQHPDREAFCALCSSCLLDSPIGTLSFWANKKKERTLALELSGRFGYVFQLSRNFKRLTFLLLSRDLVCWDLVFLSHGAMLPAGSVGFGGENLVQAGAMRLADARCEANQVKTRPCRSVTAWSGVVVAVVVLLHLY